jgi:protein-L-isoaspartate(D-aspartate) O-methyltransferase
MSVRGIGMTSARTRERLIDRLRAQGITDTRVIERIRHVPRHLFVDEALASRAYEDTALPLGCGQTISQPYVVARMCEALCAGGQPGKVLEVGTGSGYQTAVLAGLVRWIYSIERLAPLLAKARTRLAELRLNNVQFRHGDGWLGWKSNAPYDGIVVSAAPAHVPSALIEQLADGGRLIIPVGMAGAQELLCIRRTGSEIVRERLELVSFVPLLEGIA